MITLRITTLDELEALIDALDQYTENQREYLETYADAPAEQTRRLAAAEVFLDQLLTHVAGGAK